MRDHLSVLLEKIYKWRFLDENLEELCSLERVSLFLLSF